MTGLKPSPRMPGYGQTLKFLGVATAWVRTQRIFPAWGIFETCKPANLTEVPCSSAQVDGSQWHALSAWLGRAGECQKPNPKGAWTAPDQKFAFWQIRISGI
jgi:hypothetical protein